MLRNHIPVPDVDDIPSALYKTINEGIHCITTCVSDCCSSFFYAKPSPRLLANQNVTQKLKECNELSEAQNNDIDAIERALKTCRMDVRASYKETTLLLASYQSQYVMQQPIAAYDKNIEKRADMLSYLSELLSSYPELRPEDETSLEGLTVFYNERHTKHQEVMQLVEIYLPETYAALKEAQPILKI